MYTYTHSTYKTLKTDYRKKEYLAICCEKLKL